MLLPADDTHFHPYIGHGYQREAYLKALPYVKDFSLAVDVGAHVGFWTLGMLKDFDEVHSFEPEPVNFACLSKNAPEAIRHNVALGEIHGLCHMETPAIHNSGAWEAREGGDIDVLPLDGFMLEPGLIKIDVQGMELAVLKGAENTIITSKPVLVVECILNGIYSHEPERFLNGLGLKAVAQVNKDVIFADL